MTLIAGLYAGFAVFYNLQAQGPKNDEKNIQQDIRLDKHDVEINGLKHEIAEQNIRFEKYFQQIQLEIAELKVLSTRNAADLQQITNKLWR